MGSPTAGERDREREGVRKIERGRERSYIIKTITVRERERGRKGEDRILQPLRVLHGDFKPPPAKIFVTPVA